MNKPNSQLCTLNSQLAIIFTLLIIGVQATFAQQKGTLTDPRDGKTYKTVKIGDQVWMAENINYDASGSKCYDNLYTNCSKYGRLYEWETAMKICPRGWHLPNSEEWEILIDYVGAENAATKLKARNGWNKNGSGTDNYGFSALPGGNGSSNGKFGYVGEYGGWWTASRYYGETDLLQEAYYRFIYSERNSVGGNTGVFKDRFSRIHSLFSVRCVRD